MPSTIIHETAPSNATMLSKTSVARSGNATNPRTLPPECIQRISLSDGRSAIDGRHLQHFARRKAEFLAQQLAHLGEQAQARIAREAVGPETNVEAERAQSPERERGVTKKSVAARAVGDVKLRRGAEQIEIAGIELVQVRDDPALVDRSRSQEKRKGRLPAAIFHRTSDLLEEIEGVAPRVAKHFHFFARFGEVRG